MKVYGLYQAGLGFFNGCGWQNWDKAVYFRDRAVAEDRRDSRHGQQSAGVDCEIVEIDLDDCVCDIRGAIDAGRAVLNTSKIEEKQ